MSAVLQGGVGDEECQARPDSKAGGVEEPAVDAADHLGLVYSISWDLVSSSPWWVDREDIVSSGMVGLMEAAAAFDPAWGVPFGGFARQRIRGAMLDSIRRSSSQSQVLVFDITSDGVKDAEASDGWVCDLVEAELDTHQTQCVFGLAAGAMPPLHRRLLIGHVFEGLSVRRMATELGVSPSRARAAFCEAVNALRDVFVWWWPEHLQPLPSYPVRSNAVQVATFATLSHNMSSGGGGWCAAVMCGRGTIDGDPTWCERPLSCGTSLTGQPAQSPLAVQSVQLA